MLAATATRIVEAMANGDIVYVAADERTARTIAAAVQAMTGDPVIHVPASDALPGEDARASPANAGRRVAALRHLHALQVDDIVDLLAGYTDGWKPADLYRCMLVGKAWRGPFLLRLLRRHGSIIELGNILGVKWCLRGF